jgi:hypothetical protein
LCRVSRRLDVGPTSLDGSTADHEVARFGPTTPTRARKLVDASVDQTEARKLP